MWYHKKEVQSFLKLISVLNVLLLYLADAYAIMQEVFPEGKKVSSNDNSDETLVQLRMLGALPKKVNGYLFQKRMLGHKKFLNI